MTDLRAICATKVSNNLGLAKEGRSQSNKSQKSWSSYIFVCIKYNHQIINQGLHMTIEKAFGSTWKKLRKEKGLSREALTPYSRLHRTYIRLLERGIKSPSLNKKQS
jgi:hypothetical protein